MKIARAALLTFLGWELLAGLLGLFLGLMGELALLAVLLHESALTVALTFAVGVPAAAYGTFIASGLPWDLFRQAREELRA